MGGFAPGPSPSPTAGGPAPPNLGGWSGLANSIYNLASAGILVYVASSVLKVAQAVYWLGFATESIAVSLRTTATALKTVSIVESLIVGFLGALIQVFNAIKATVASVVSGLKMLGVGTLWRWLKKAWDYYKRFRRWYRDHIQGPIDRMRRNLQDIYNRFFRPILHILDTLRRVTQIIAVFNRKLARKLDSYLFGLEARLLAPWYAAVRRLNALSSWATAIMTRSGLFDRAVFVETLGRDWKSIWKVLANNGNFPSPRAAGAPFAYLAQLEVDSQTYFRDGTGPIADQVAGLEQDFDDARAQIG